MYNNLNVSCECCPSVSVVRVWVLSDCECYLSIIIKIQLLLCRVKILGKSWKAKWWPLCVGVILDCFLRINVDVTSCTRYSEFDTRCHCPPAVLRHIRIYFTYCCPWRMNIKKCSSEYWFCFLGSMLDLKADVSQILKAK